MNTGTTLAGMTPQWMTSGECRKARCAAPWHGPSRQLQPSDNIRSIRMGRPKSAWLNEDKEDGYRK